MQASSIQTLPSNRGGVNSKIEGYQEYVRVDDAVIVNQDDASYQAAVARKIQFTRDSKNSERIDNLEKKFQEVNATLETLVDVIKSINTRHN